MLLFIWLADEKVVIFCLVFWYLKIIVTTPGKKGIVTPIGAYLISASSGILISKLPH